MKILVFDTETTGLPVGYNPSIYDTHLWPHLLQLSYILYDADNNTVITINDSIIKISPDIIISKETTNINGITNLQCKRYGVPIVEVLSKFNDQIKQADCILAHNISFDKRIIMVECIRKKLFCHLSKKSESPANEYCTMKGGKNICKIEKLNKKGELYYKYPTLSELHYQLFNHIPNNTHNALVDILICLRCYLKLKYSFDIINKNNKIKTLFKKFDI